MFEPEPNDPTLPELEKQLAQAEAAEAAQAGQQTGPEPKADSATTESTARTQGDGGQVDSTISKESGGDTSPAQPKKPDEPQKPGEPTKPGEESKYRKDQIRRESSWKQLNEEKAAFQKEREALKAERDELAKLRHDLETQRQKSSQPKYKPEDYENTAKEWQKQADDLEAEGKYDEADEKRTLARKAIEHAKQLRENPPPAPKTDAQADADFEALRKEWWTKAAQDFPDSQKADSPVALKLRAWITPGSPEYDQAVANAVNSDPQAMYYVVRLADAEARAESVPTKDKELGELRAKVKDLTEKLSIPGAAVASGTPRVKADSEKSEQELEEELRNEAASMGLNR